MSYKPLGKGGSENDDCGDSDLQGDGTAESSNVEVTYTENMGDPDFAFLFQKFETDGPTRKLISSVETAIVERLLSKSSDWSLIFNFPTSYHRLIVHKLAEYFCLGHNFDPRSNELIIYCSQTQELKRPISDLARRKVEEYSSKRKSVKVLVNPNRHIRKLSNDQPKIPIEERTYEEKKQAYIEARSRILGVPIEECVAQFAAEESKVSHKSKNATEIDQEQVKIQFLETIRNVAHSSVDDVTEEK